MDEQLILKLCHRTGHFVENAFCQNLTETLSAEMEFLIEMYYKIRPALICNLDPHV